MIGSGKQILLKILEELSTKVVADKELETTNSRLRAGLLLHGSTADDSYERASHLIWGSDLSEGELDRQGISTKSGVFISDVFETMLEMPSLEVWVRREHPGLTHDDYESSVWALWLVVSSVQMFSQLLSVEASGDLSIDDWVEMMEEKYANHFRNRAPDPR